STGSSGRSSASAPLPPVRRRTGGRRRAPGREARPAGALGLGAGGAGAHRRPSRRARRPAGRLVGPDAEAATARPRRGAGSPPAEDRPAAGAGPDLRRLGLRTGPSRLRALLPG